MHYANHVVAPTAQASAFDPDSEILGLLEPLGDGVYAAPQLYADDMPVLGRAGIAAVVNNRPDGEDPPVAQPPGSELRQAAERAGLVYAALPVTCVEQVPQVAPGLSRLLAQLPRPTVLFCRSGRRSRMLYEQTRTAGCAGIR